MTDCTVVNSLFVMAHSFDEKFAVRQCDVFLLTAIIVGQEFSPPEKGGRLLRFIKKLS